MMETVSSLLVSLLARDLPEKGDCLLKDESRDNRSLVDDNTAQSLSGEDIEALRRQGATGDQIVEALIANSSTFEKKTLFSQEKYRLKKQKKYAPRVLVRRPFTRSICETYFKKNPAKIGFMRVDTLSLLLSMANVCAYSDVLVVDMVGGILTGAVAERLGGSGYVCNTYFGGVPYPMDITRMFNLNNEISSRIVQTSLSDLCSAQDKNSEQGGENGVKEVTHLWRANGFSSLIVAAPELDTWSAVQELLPLLSYSAPFAVYHQYLQPLATCMHNLQVSKMAIGLQISEPWLREYQVLPSRTHPSMQMSAFGGYILSGTRIFSSEISQQTS
ncbi:tRNA (adenine(58)-N(1))-methyltransferase non-catalytic subunit TRM6 isoform X2 [Telopea speciosissima]|uniref:tRNA (adenine(58)-N(1))-methyltransferase non-catalytic subunit TRM6 isoform X2 n=1 Tax=Telopea speciosissima TaxID=54955 RepID=UPI001CC3F6AA|nr:tRNA (adenine(58)-N(1))-methyltransferase non-catalytic subunit TRM6 isoform X2 [Telopea speciosissima]